MSLPDYRNQLLLCKVLGIGLIENLKKQGIANASGLDPVIIKFDQMVEEIICWSMSSPRLGLLHHML